MHCPDCIARCDPSGSSKASVQVSDQKSQRGCGNPRSRRLGSSRSQVGHRSVRCGDRHAALDDLTSKHPPDRTDDGQVECSERQLPDAPADQERRAYACGEMHYKTNEIHTSSPGIFYLQALDLFRLSCLHQTRALYVTSACVPSASGTSNEKSPTFSSKDGDGDSLLEDSTMIRALGIAMAGAIAAFSLITSSEAVAGDKSKTYRKAPQVQGYVARQGGYSYSYADTINTYGDSRSVYGATQNFRDPMLDRQTNAGPFDHGFFFNPALHPAVATRPT